MSEVAGPGHEPDDARSQPNRGGAGHAERLSGATAEPLRADVPGPYEPLRIPQRTRTAPTVKPAPTEASSTRSPFFSRPAHDGVVQRQRNRRRRGVAEPLDVDDHLLRVEAELLGWPTG